MALLEDVLTYYLLCSILLCSVLFVISRPTMRSTLPLWNKEKICSTHKIWKNEKAVPPINLENFPLPNDANEAKDENEKKIRKYQY